MDAETAHRVERDVKSRFPEGLVREVVVLEYGDDPGIEPGHAGLRVVIDLTKLAEGTERSLEGFADAHDAAVKQLNRDLPRLLPEADRLLFSDGDKSLFLVRMRFGREERAAELTPVMARLGPVDLETLDTLVTAGIAPNRAEAVRWALARIRERPAYEQLRQRAREIAELRQQF